VPSRARLIRLAVGTMLVAAMTLPASGVVANSSANASLKHVFVIMLENHSQSTVIGDPNAPYITSLAQDYGEATNYYGVTHPSLPNFLFANGYSGHGLQQAPAVGRGLAEWIASGRYETLDLSPLGYERIARGAPVLELNVV